MLPDVVKQMKALVADALSDVHTAMPGTIKSVDPATGTATVIPTGQFKTAGGKSLEYPAISGVPLVFPMGAAQGVGMVFPVKEGDTCLLVIAEQALDAWLYGGESTSDLKHDLTNAIAIPGLFVKANKMAQEAISTASVIIYSGEKKITVSQRGIAIRGDLTVEGTISSTGDIKASGSLTAAQGGIDAGGTMTVNNINASGNVTVGGDVKAGAISLGGHKHTSAASGQDTTGPK